MGEAVLAHVAKDRGIDLYVESAGTADYHVGEEPDERTVAVCKKYEVPVDHKAQQVRPQHFREFDYILASDAANMNALSRITPTDSTADVKLWGYWDDGKPIADPYYGNMDGFETCFEQCKRYSNAFLDALVAKQAKSAL